jgi:hypothetical protein
MGKAAFQARIEEKLRSQFENDLPAKVQEDENQKLINPDPAGAGMRFPVSTQTRQRWVEEKLRSQFENDLPAKVQAAWRDHLQERFNTAGVPISSQRPKSDIEREAYYKNYTEMVRQEAIRDLADHIFKRHSATDATPLDDEFQRIANRWLVGVRSHDKWSDLPLFRDKVRGHGQAAGSTDGRLLRKLMMAATQKEVTSNPHFDPYRNNIIAARNRLNDAERALESNPRSPQLRQNHTDAKRELSRQSQILNTEVASKLGDLLSRPGGSLALRKAIFLTQEKLRDPKNYKQQYARVVPFDHPRDPTNHDKWVKASRRFYTPADVPLDLPLRSDGTVRNNSVVKMGQPPVGLPPFGPDAEELINDVGQKDLGECWLQASAASLPRQTLGNMFSWRPSHGSEGVTTRLHDENGNPIYIRTQKNQLWNDASAHKALWSAALAAAASKVGRNSLTEFRHGVKPRNENGMPLHTVRDVYGNSIDAAAKLLTGKLPLVYGDLRHTPRNLFEEAKQKGAEKGVAIFRTPNLQGAGTRGHAMTFFNLNEKTGRGRFGDTLASGPKSFWDALDNVDEMGFLDPSGANPAKDRFVPASSSASLTPDEYEERQRGRLGNFGI